MDEPIIETPAVIQPVEVVEQPNQNGSDAVVAPNLDNELDEALSKAFTKQTEQPQEKTKEKASNVKDTKKEPVEKTESKNEKPKVESELPSPDSIDQSPSKKQDGWNALRNNYKRAHRIISERDEEIKTLKSGLAEKGSTTSKEVEQLKKEIGELSKYRTMIDIQADPEFISKYDQPLEKAQAGIKEMLMGMNVSKDVVDQIDFTNTKLMDEIAGHIEENRDKFQSKKFQRKVEEVLEIMEKRDETLVGHSKNYKEFMETKKKESSMKGAENEGRMIKHLESITASKDKEGNIMFPFLSKITPKDSASQAENDQAANHNRLVDVMQKKLNEAMKYEDPESRAELAVAAVSAHYLKAQLTAAIQKIKGLESEVSKIAAISTDTERQKPRNPTGKNGRNEYVDLDTALSEHFVR